jgi:hypothetical protein
LSLNGNSTFGNFRNRREWFGYESRPGENLKRTIYENSSLLKKLKKKKVSSKVQETPLAFKSESFYDIPEEERFFLLREEKEKVLLKS